MPDDPVPLLKNTAMLNEFNVAHGRKRPEHAANIRKIQRYLRNPDLPATKRAHYEAQLAEFQKLAPAPAKPSAMKGSVR